MLKGRKTKRTFGIFFFNLYHDGKGFLMKAGDL